MPVKGSRKAKVLLRGARKEDKRILPIFFNIDFPCNIGLKDFLHNSNACIMKKIIFTIIKGATAFSVFFIMTFSFNTACTAQKSSAAAVSQKKTEKLLRKREGSEKRVEEKKYAEGEVIVRFGDAVSEKEVARINSIMDASAKQKIPVGKNTFLLQLPEGLSVPEAVDKYKKFDEVEYAHPNYIYKALTDGNAQ